MDERRCYRCYWNTPRKNWGYIEQRGNMWRVEWDDTITFTWWSDKEVQHFMNPAVRLLVVLENDQPINFEEMK